MKYILALLLMWTLNVCGQDFKGISFDDEAFCWQDYYWNDSLSLYKQNFILPQAPAVIDDKYLLSLANFNAPDKEGYLVNLKDMLTGELIWQMIAYSEEQYTRQFANNFLIKEGVLELYLFEEAKNVENIIYPPWYEGHLALLKLDVLTGEVLEEVRTDHYDPENLFHLVSTHGQRPYIAYVDSLFRVVDAGYAFSSFTENRTIGFSAISVINRQGHLIDADTSYYDFPYCRRPFFTVHAWFDHLGNYSKIIGGQLLNDSICSRTILVNDFETMEAVDISSILQEKQEQHVLASSTFMGDKFSIIAGTRYIDHNTRYTGSCYIFTKGGDLLDSLSLSYVVSEGSQINGVMFDLDENQIYLTKKFEEEEAIKFQFYMNNEDGSQDTIFRLETLDTDLSIFSFYPYYFGSNKFMFTVRHRRPSIPPTPVGIENPVFFYYSVIDLSKKPNRLAEESVPEIKVFPNPTQSVVYLESEESISAWQLYSVFGVLVESGEWPGSQIDFGKIASGSYVLTLETGNNNFRNFKLIICNSN